MTYMLRKRSPIEETELVGVPHYVQGEADGLCVYYAVSMMLAALHPEWRLRIHDAPRGKDLGGPVFHGLREFCPSKGAYDRKLSDWFFNGITIPEATRLLNRYFQRLRKSKEPYFIRRRVRARRARRIKGSSRLNLIDRVWNANELIDCIGAHLPVIVAGGGLGAHAVVAVGYRLRGSEDRQICVLDPSVLRAEWRAIGDVFVRDAEVIAPNENLFTTYRPARVRRLGRDRSLRQWQNGAAVDCPPL